MKTVLMCDFCRFTTGYHEDAEMKKHETTCYNNPAAKLCDTCGNCYQPDPYSDHRACKKGNDVYDIELGPEPCNDWVEK